MTMWWFVLCRNRMLLLLLIVSLLVSFHPQSVTIVDCSSNHLQWQIITDSNYSAQIRLNPSFLLLVTVPWSGESRTLMKEIAHEVASDQVRFDDLKLMVLYRNVDGKLASALGAENEITVFYYHNASGYKYSGRLRVQNILSSVHYVMSLMPNDLPFKSLTTPEELRDFVGSTDKAVILFEFCGWTQRLLSMNQKATKYAFDFSSEGNTTLEAEEKDNMKVDGRGDEHLSCGISKEFTEMSWPSQFPFSNGSFIEPENLTVNAGASCTLDELKHFDLFLQKFIPLSRKLFLPPERIKFAVASEISLLPLLNVGEPGSWCVSVSFAACPSCLKVVREVGSLKTILQAQFSSVAELQDDDGLEANLPPKRPSILLFVDRSSDSMQVKIESQKALNSFREVAKQYEMGQMANHVLGQGHKTLTKSKRASLEAVKHSRLQPFKASGKLSSQNKMSVMIINEGQQITIENLVSNLQGSSVQEILSYALKSKKEKTLSSLVKDAGFQLLSKDFDIEVVESSDTHNDGLNNQVLEDVEVGIGSSTRLDGNKIEVVGKSGQSQELHTYVEADHILQQHMDDSADENSYLEPEHNHHSVGIETAKSLGWDDNNSLSGIDINENQNIFQGSFFFLDGQYRLLETLTGCLKIPSIVILDPISEQHYIFHELSMLNSSLLSVFINNFLSGELSPYQQSAPAVHSPRSAPKPPFVNLDFHETEYIPLVTTHTFGELVLGNTFNLKRSGGSWNRNVLVLFSNSWCGFCQRMELVVREVYRAIEGYGEAIRINSTRKEKWTSTEFVDDVGLKLPLIYMMDCTLNDCSLIIKPKKQRDLYPLLVLYPEEMKNNTVVYEGNVAVSDIVKFLVEHGSHMLQDLFMDKRLSFTRKQSSVKQGLQTMNLNPEVVSTDTFQEVAVKYDEEPFLYTGSADMPALSPGCLLIATERLQYVNPFDNSKILIVKLDRSFQGLIINKQMSWESLPGTEEGFEFLRQAPLSFGGPVVRQGMPLVALTRNKFVEDGVEVLPNVYFLDEVATLKLLEDLRQGNGDKTVDEYWFFLGSSSWGFKQLSDEIAQGAWNVTHGSLNQLEWPWISSNDS